MAQPAKVLLAGCSSGHRWEHRLNRRGQPEMVNLAQGVQCTCSRIYERLGLNIKAYSELWHDETFDLLNRFMSSIPFKFKVLSTNNTVYILFSSVSVSFIVPPVWQGG